MRKVKILLIFLAIMTAFCVYPVRSASAQMPFYGLKPEKLVLRATFSTNYADSGDARKRNIKLACKSINNVLVDVGGEFSFNLTVGERTEKRGYESAKIIVGDKFVDGVGGGVCQVSTTLYNAVLLAGLKVTEVHPHSLPVKYIAPSFDAMVNSGSSDFRFINDTDNPVIIESYADGITLTVKIYGQKLNCKITRKSVIKEKVSPPPPEITVADKNEYPDLKAGESLAVKYGKEGIKSAGYVVLIYPDGKTTEKRIRNDYYKEVQGKIVIGAKDDA